MLFLVGGDGSAMRQHLRWRMVRYRRSASRRDDGTTAVRVAAVKESNSRLLG
jgi:hypothetical protein